jgi:hypothetical protein
MKLKILSLTGAALAVSLVLWLPGAALGSTVHSGTQINPNQTTTYWYTITLAQTTGL